MQAASFDGAVKRSCLCRFNQCYGVLGILDRLHNTNAQFLASKNYQRHIMHFSLTPVKVAFPDPDKTGK